MPEAPESRSYADESSLDQSSASVSASSDYPANFGEWEKKIAIQKHESAANSTKLHPPLPPEEAPHKPNYELNITTHDIDVIEKERKDSTINQLPVVPDSPYVNFILFPSALNDKHSSASDTAPRLQHQSQEPSFGWSKQPWQPVGLDRNSFFICNSKHFDRGFMNIDKMVMPQSMKLVFKAKAKFWEEVKIIIVSVIIVLCKCGRTSDKKCFLNSMALQIS